jgi:hypothetical protein
MYMSTHIVHELHRRRIAELEREAALRRVLPAPRGTRRRVRFAIPRPRRHPALDARACR